LEFNIVNRIYPDGKTSYNTVAEIPGTDKADEMIMLGGHLDSWHAATGATDNAIGCAIMMEAARILKTLGVEPRRTIRVALWSGEEEGLLGSQAYVKEHFEVLKIRNRRTKSLAAISISIPARAVCAAPASLVHPRPPASCVKSSNLLRTTAVVGAAASRSRNLGGSDNTSFSNAGLPGIGMGQDPMNMAHTPGTRIWTLTNGSRRRCEEGRS